MVGNLEKLSRALSSDTPEKIWERELQKKAPQILAALRQYGFYDDETLGVRISATV